MKEKIDVRKLKRIYRIRGSYPSWRSGSVERIKVIHRTKHSLFLSCTRRVGYKDTNRIGIRWLQDLVDRGISATRNLYLTEADAYKRLLFRFTQQEKYHRIEAATNKRAAARARRRIAALNRRRKSR